MALASMLQQMGATVVAAAHTYEDAIALLDGGPRCEVMFIDLMLHGRTTGIDVARRAARQGVSVVVMTGAAPLSDEVAGAGLLMKPYSLEQVRAVMHGIMRARRPCSP